MINLYLLIINLSISKMMSNCDKSTSTSTTTMTETEAPTVTKHRTRCSSAPKSRSYVQGSKSSRTTMTITRHPTKYQRYSSDTLLGVCLVPECGRDFTRSNTGNKSRGVDSSHYLLHLTQDGHCRLMQQQMDSNDLEVFYSALPEGFDDCKDWVEENTVNHGEPNLNNMSRVVRMFGGDGEQSDNRWFRKMYLLYMMVAVSVMYYYFGQFDLKVLSDAVQTYLVQQLDKMPNITIPKIGFALPKIDMVDLSRYYHL